MQSVDNLQFSRVGNQTRPTTIRNETAKERLVLDLAHCQKNLIYVNDLSKNISSFLFTTGKFRHNSSNLVKYMLSTIYSNFYEIPIKSNRYEKHLSY